MTSAHQAPERKTPSPGSDIAYPDAKMHLVRPTEPALGRVVRNELCTAAGSKAAGFVRHVEIDVAGTPLEGSFLAGQSFGVLPPGADEHGKPHKVRLYSIASPSQGEDGAGRVLATTVKRTVAEHWETGALFLGVASNYLCDLRPGDQVRVAGPNGKRFLLPSRPDEHDYLFFATGTGVAPFRGMAMELLRAGRKSRVTLVMGAPYRTDLLYHEQLLELARQHENFSYLPAVSREPDGDAARGVYVQDRLCTHGSLLEPALRSSRTLVYICGIAGMELGILQALTRGLPPEARAQYLSCDEQTAAEVDGWTRRMLHREVKPTRRVFIEVY